MQVVLKLRIPFFRNPKEGSCPHEQGPQKDRKLKNYPNSLPEGSSGYIVAQVLGFRHAITIAMYYYDCSYMVRSPKIVLIII